VIPPPEKTEEELAEELNSNEFVVAGREAREELELSANPPTEAFKAWDQGDHEFALDLLQKEVEIAADDPDRRDLLRKVMVGYFTELGPTSELAATHRRRLATFF
jgi:thioredoxin-like negative regulator of GroEL